MFELPLPQDDGLLIPPVRQHSRDKHYFLMRYMDAFTTSMKDKGWGGLHYVDLFAGAGIERLEESGELDWGSPMIAAQTRFPFNRLHLCEMDPEKFTALKARIEKVKPGTQLFNDDSNRVVGSICKETPQRSLSLAFIDPYGLHFEFDTLRTLSAKARADLIILFPDHMDAVRNWNLYYRDNPDSNLDRYLGPGVDWRGVLDEAPSHSVAGTLRKLYIEQIKTLGYRYFATQRICRAGGQPLYVLILCSRNKVAVKLWDRISQKGPDGQRTLPFHK